MSIKTITTLMAIVLTACTGEESVCSPGGPGCPCNVLGACDEGLDCHRSTCVSPREIHLSFAASAARACEFVVHDGESRVLGIDFPDDVQGTSIRRGVRTAVTFVARADVPIASVLTLRTTGLNDPTVDVSIGESRCFDETGSEISGGGVSL